MIRDDKLQQIPGALQAGARHGMQTLNAHLASHVRAGRVSREAGLEHCSDREDFLSLVGSKSTLAAGTMVSGNGTAGSNGAAPAVAAPTSSWS